MTTKTAAAQAIYEELKAANDPDIRKKFIARCKEELGMGDAGAATYYQNAKKKSDGGTSSERAARPSKKMSVAVNTDPWSVVRVVDERVTDCYTFVGQQAAEQAYSELREENKQICEVIQGTIPVGTEFILGG